jgi:hypothetical protein
VNKPSRSLPARTDQPCGVCSTKNIVGVRRFIIQYSRTRDLRAGQQPPRPVSPTEAPSGSSAPGLDRNANAASTMPLNVSSAAGARGDMGDTQAPAADEVSPAATEAANDNDPAEQPAATGTE